MSTKHSWSDNRMMSAGKYWSPSQTFTMMSCAAAQDPLENGIEDVQRLLVAEELAGLA